MTPTHSCFRRVRVLRAPCFVRVSARAAAPQGCRGSRPPARARAVAGPEPRRYGHLYMLLRENHLYSHEI